MKSYQIEISGKVQGVWFRVSTLKKAQELSIRGIVRNQADGTVYIEAEGDESNLKNFIEWCHQGSEHSEVKHVEIIEVEKKYFTDFQIVR